MKILKFSLPLWWQHAHSSMFPLHPITPSIIEQCSLQVLQKVLAVEHGDQWRRGSRDDNDRSSRFCTHREQYGSEWHHFPHQQQQALCACVHMTQQTCVQNKDSPRRRIGGRERALSLIKKKDSQTTGSNQTTDITKTHNLPRLGCCDCGAIEQTTRPMQTHTTQSFRWNSKMQTNCTVTLPRHTQNYAKKQTNKNKQSKQKPENKMSSTYHHWSIAVTSDVKGRGLMLGVGNLALPGGQTAHGGHKWRAHTQTMITGKLDPRHPISVSLVNFLFLIIFTVARGMKVWERERKRERERERERERPQTPLQGGSYSDRLQRHAVVGSKCVDLETLRLCNTGRSQERERERSENVQYTNHTHVHTHTHTVKMAVIDWWDRPLCLFLTLFLEKKKWENDKSKPHRASPWTVPDRNDCNQSAGACATKRERGTQRDEIIQNWNTGINHKQWRENNRMNSDK